MDLIAQATGACSCGATVEIPQTGKVIYFCHCRVVRDVLRALGSPVAELADAISLYNRADKRARGFAKELCQKWVDFMVALRGRHLTAADLALFDKNKIGARKVGVPYAPIRFRRLLH